MQNTLLKSDLCEIRRNALLTIFNAYIPFKMNNKHSVEFIADIASKEECSQLSVTFPIQNKTFKYNENGYVILEERNIDSNGKADYRAVYSYNDYGNVIFTEIFDNNSDIKLQKIAYDEKGNILFKEIDYNADGNTDKKFSYNYDSCGYIQSAELCYYDEFGNIDKKYTYDGNGNIISVYKNLYTKNSK